MVNSLPVQPGIRALRIDVNISVGWRGGVEGRGEGKRGDGRGREKKREERGEGEVGVNSRDISLLCR